MGKKSRKVKGDGGAAGADESKASRCRSCKRYLKKDGMLCPGCDNLYCDECASWGSRKNIGFITCNNTKCTHPARCSDCAFGKTLMANGKKNKARRERGEPVVIADKMGNCDFPISMCGNCNEILCSPCSGSFTTKGEMGHYNCFECAKTRCYECCVESGDPKHFIMHCWGCDASKCSECDPYKMCDGDTFEYYCGKCCTDASIVGGKHLVLATIVNSAFGKKK